MLLRSFVLFVIFVNIFGTIEGIQPIFLTCKLIYSKSINEFKIKFNINVSKGVKCHIDKKSKYMFP